LSSDAGRGEDSLGLRGAAAGPAVIVSVQASPQVADLSVCP